MKGSRIIELGIILCDKGEVVETYNSIVKPDNFTKLDPFITKLTGITDEQIINEGKDLKDIFKEIEPLLDKAKILNSYNINYDYNVLLSELYRHRTKKYNKKTERKKTECTYQLSKDIYI